MRLAQIPFIPTTLDFGRETNLKGTRENAGLLKGVRALTHPNMAKTLPEVRRLITRCPLDIAANTGGLCGWHRLPS